MVRFGRTALVKHKSCILFRAYEPVDHSVGSRLRIYGKQPTRNGVGARTALSLRAQFCSLLSPRSGKAHSVTKCCRPKSGTLFEMGGMMEEQKNNTQRGDIARRDFVALSAAAGLATTAESAAAAGLDVIEMQVDIKTPDGACDAAFIHPRTGSHAGVLIWPDAFGLRPSMREIAKRIAAEGYSVLVPNPFYRVAKAPFSDASTFIFQNPADMAKLKPLMASVTAAGNAEKDAVAYVAFLDTQKEVDKSKKIGTQGYCMGGPLVVKTAAALP